MANPAIRFENPEMGNLGAFIKSSSARDLPFVERGCHSADRGAVICGLGPSLQKPSVLREVRKYAKRGWTVFGLKEAIDYLRDKGIPVHYAVNMDPTTKEIARTPVYEGIVYCLASSCHPELYDHVLGNAGEILVYHSACGYHTARFEPTIVLELGGDQLAVIQGGQKLATTEGNSFFPVASRKIDEMSYYRSLFGIGDTITGGFTVGNRAVGLAKYMGFERIVCAGLDFGWRDGDDYYAAFCKAEPIRDIFMNDGGKVDGRPWHSRPDLLASAVDLAHKVKAGGVRVLGDSLAKSLAKHPDDYLERVCQVVK